MKTLSHFVAKFAGLIVSVLSCFDRVIFEGDLSISNGPALEGKELFDGVDHCIEMIRLGQIGFDLPVQEKNATPTAYDRAKVIEKRRMAMVLCGAPLMMAPQEIMSVCWVYRLGRSIPGDEPRSYLPGVEPAWFGGNISVSVLRVLDNLTQPSSDVEYENASPIGRATRTITPSPHRRREAARPGSRAQEVRRS
jgi:hypothetical protein